MSFLLTGDRSGLGLISVYSHALFFGLCTRAVVLLLLLLLLLFSALGAKPGRNPILTMACFLKKSTSET